MGAHADPGQGRGWRLDPGRSRRPTLTNAIPERRPERGLSRRGAGGRRAFRRPLRACAGAYGRVCAGGSQAGGGDVAAGPPALQSHAPGILSGQWPGAHRRRLRLLFGAPHKRQGDGGQGRAAQRSDCRVSVPGASSQLALIHNFSRDCGTRLFIDVLGLKLRGSTAISRRPGEERRSCHEPETGAGLG